MKTYSAKPADVTRQWHILDASETSLGRLSTVAATLLLGKHKPSRTSHVDTGDFVVVINAGQLLATGNKTLDKNYYRHSGFPGGLSKRTLTEQMERDPSKVVFNSVRGMLPVDKLRPERLKRLKIYVDAEHKHSSQNPQAYSLKKDK